MEKDMVEVTGVKLRCFNGKVEVLVEVGGSWRLAISERYDDEGVISHIVEPSGIRRAPIEEANA